jgi:hypothetical protein
MEPKPHEAKPSSPTPAERRARYWAAYRRGVQRGVCGSVAVPDAEHQRWLASPAHHLIVEQTGYTDGVRFGESLVRICAER